MSFKPTKEDRFTFGLWTVGNPGRDPFGVPTREPIPPAEIVRKLAELGAMGVNLHDEDLIPFGASLDERRRIINQFEDVLAKTGMQVPMVTTNLFTHPAFKEGAFTSRNARVRALAIQKAMAAMDLGVELGAKIFVCWGGREGSEVDASKAPTWALTQYRYAINWLCEYALQKGYAYKIALEAKPNEPRGHIYLPTTGAMLGFIATLDHPEMVGVNPEVAHETMAGLSFPHAVAQALDAGKLFHIDLNDQLPGRFDQDLRFGSADLKSAFYLVWLLERHRYKGPLHFDAHALRTEDPAGVWEFAAACMRMYLILRDKVRQFEADSTIQALLAKMQEEDGEDLFGLPKFTPRGAAALREAKFDDVHLLGGRPCYLEKLDGYVDDILLGVPHGD